MYLLAYYMCIIQIFWFLYVYVSYSAYCEADDSINRKAIRIAHKAHRYAFRDSNGGFQQHSQYSLCSDHVSKFASFWQRSNFQLWMFL
jgi:hypothetical protein